MGTNFTEKEYEEAIPKCCSCSTIKSHKDMLLCWSLVSALKNNNPMNCGNCDLKIKLTHAQEG
jgi:hypothetical protein